MPICQYCGSTHAATEYQTGYFVEGPDHHVVTISGEKAALDYGRTHKSQIYWSKAAVTTAVSNATVKKWDPVTGMPLPTVAEQVVIDAIMAVVT